MAGNEVMHTPAEELVLVIDEDGDKIEISTPARINGRMIPVCTVEIGFNEPMESLQTRYADQIVSRFNAHDDLMEALKPFADIAAVFDPPNSGSRPDSGEVYVWSKMVDGAPRDYTLTVEMLRNARAALTKARSPSVPEVK